MCLLLNPATMSQSNHAIMQRGLGVRTLVACFNTARIRRTPAAPHPGPLPNGGVGVHHLVLTEVLSDTSRLLFMTSFVM